MYSVSSTRFGSTSTSRNDSGEWCVIRLVMMPLIDTLLPDPVAPAMSRWGIPVRSTAIGCPATPRPSAMARPPRFATRWNSRDSITPRNETMRVSLLGTSMPMTGWPGTGASTRIDGAARASARSLVSRVILFTRTRVRPISSTRRTGLPSSSSCGAPSASFTATVRVFTSQPGSTPNCVTDGPSLICVTCASTPNDASVSMITCACRALSLLPVSFVSGLSRLSGGRIHPSGLRRRPFSSDGSGRAGSSAGEGDAFCCVGAPLPTSSAAGASATVSSGAGPDGAAIGAGGRWGSAAGRVVSGAYTSADCSGPTPTSHISVGRRRGRVIQSMRNCRTSQRLPIQASVPPSSSACAVWWDVIKAEIVTAISSMIATPWTDASHAPTLPVAEISERSAGPSVHAGVKNPAIPRPIA